MSLWDSLELFCNTSIIDDFFLSDVDDLLYKGISIDIYYADLTFSIPAHEPRLLHDLILILEAKS